MHAFNLQRSWHRQVLNNLFCFIKVSVGLAHLASPCSWVGPKLWIILHPRCVWDLRGLSGCSWSSFMFVTAKRRIDNLWLPQITSVHGWVLQKSTLWTDHLPVPYWNHWPIRDGPMTGIQRLLKHDRLGAHISHFQDLTLNHDFWLW